VVTAISTVEVAMHKSVQLRWIAEAEARSVREFARLQRTESELRGSVACTGTSPVWFDWLRRMVPKGAWPVPGARSFPAGMAIWKARSGATSRNPTTEADSDRVLVTVLITDIVDSTKRVAEMGDRPWRALLDRHDDATRNQIKRFGGREVSNRGDGFLAIFDGPARAVRCAAAIAETIAPLGISVRSGIHVGEIHLKRDEISGIAVHIAARIATIARPGEAFVSKTVCDLVTGSGLVFEDRGIHQLRGLPEEIHLYAMRPLGGVAIPASLA
jgi:class 3 adenylate cyclase